MNKIIKELNISYFFVSIASFREFWNGSQTINQSFNLLLQ